MTLQQIIDTVCSDSRAWVVIAIVILSLIQIAPIKVDPWGAIFRWIGKQINADVNARMDKIESKLDKHIEESEQRDIRNRRSLILDFSNACMNHRGHTKEEFDFIITECDRYQIYCKENNIPNGVADAAIKEIKRVYDYCIRHNSFLVGEDDEEQN